jgi:hypothetical protein
VIVKRKSPFPGHGNDRRDEREKGLFLPEVFKSYYNSDQKGQETLFFEAENPRLISDVLSEKNYLWNK